MTLLSPRSSYEWLYTRIISNTIFPRKTIEWAGQIKPLQQALSKAQQTSTRVAGSVAGQRQAILRRSHDLWGEEKAVTIIGEHPALLAPEEKLTHFAQSDMPVLLMGESGVGKEIFAQSLYLLSARYGKPFVSVNCEQFQDQNMMVSELFGHSKGSFTGAVAERKGVFEAANTGVVFLDEVGELSAIAQAMLLRVLENNEIRPLGGEKAKQVDIRVISATHRDLLELVEMGAFRKDLYYRLNGLHLHIPPLRERLSDILLLAEHFLGGLNKQHGIKKHLSPAAQDFLLGYAFPGNVRELRSMVATGYLLSDTSLIDVKDIADGRHNRRRNDFDSKGTSHLYRQMAVDGQSFWEIVHKPFLARDLNRAQVQAIIRQGLQEAGSYKQLLALFGVDEKDYKKFMNFLQQHRLKSE